MSFADDVEEGSAQDAVGIFCVSDVGPETARIGEHRAFGVDVAAPHGTELAGACGVIRVPSDALGGFAGAGGADQLEPGRVALVGAVRAGISSESLLQCGAFSAQLALVNRGELTGAAGGGRRCVVL